MNGSDFDDNDQDNKPQLEFQTQEAAKDYLVGVSKSLQDDLKREMLVE